MAKNNFTGRILKGTQTQPSLKGASGVWTLDEALQYHRANQWPQPNLYQPIPNSLRFKGNSPASYLIHQNTRIGSNTTGTISFWTKISYSSNDSHFFQTVDALNGSSGANRLYMAFTTATGTGALYVYGQDGSGNQSIYFVTTQAFRDFSAWYHVVIAIDSTQPTQANRFKLYINGVQVTSFTTASYPSQGAVIAFSSNATTFVGCNRGPSLPYTGEMSEFYFIDGYALASTMFGQYDTNGRWVPVPYTGSYGNNGFYLPFSNATTSQTLGYDASFNGSPSYGPDQDPYRSSVALHLTGNGSIGGNNNIFVDSGSNLAVTRQGSVITQGSFSPFPILANVPYNPTVHGASAYFNNTPGENLLVTASSVNAIGSGQFTIEAWVYIKSGKSGVSGNGTHTIISQGNNSSNLLWQLYVALDGSSLYWGLTTQAVNVTTTIPLNSWVHIAITRDSSNSEKIFVNGALVNTRTNTSNYNSVSGYQIQIGSSYDTNYPSVYSTNSYSNTLWGYIGGIRLIPGSAIYVSSFTPMLKPFGTLTNNLVPCSENFFGNSTYWNVTTANNATITANAGIAPDGTPTATSVIPFSGTYTSQPHFYGNEDSTTTGTYVTSIYIKANGYRYASFSRGISNVYGIHVDLLTGTVLGTFSGGTGVTGISYSVTNAGNGWWRCSVIASESASPAGRSITAVTSTNSSTVPSTNSYSVTGDGVSGCLVWGAQNELASSLGNYTPTPANYRTASSMLLNFANGAVVDSSGAQNATTYNNVTISGTAKTGSGAIYFNGVSDYMTLPASTSLAFGTGNFTIEFWTYSPTIGSNTCILDIQGGIMVRQNSNNSLLLYSRASGTQLLATANNTLMPNVWNHVAVVRIGTAITAYINGQNVGSASCNDNFGSTSSTYIGAFFNTQSNPYVYQGQLDDFRITNGVARYQTNFTPPVRALPEVGGRSFVTNNINAGVVQKFTTVGTTSWTAPSDVAQVELLVVAGGGGGGQYAGGGGGAGGLIYNNQYPVTPGQTYTVTVGAGGAGAPGNSTAGSTRGTSGNNSQFGNLTAIGGGGGGVYSTSGNTGGSGGGGGGGSSGTYAGGSGTAGQGFAGGYGIAGGSENGGGGGGAGAVGTNATAPNTNGYAGGNGLQFGISGTPTYYAGGGGGGSVGSSYTAGAGGLGGGGNGISYQNQPVTANIGVANTGGGGGGGGYVGAYPGAAGGSGIVIVRYTTTAVANTSDLTTDNLVDSPTLYGHDYGNGGEVVGNYCTWNPVDTTARYLTNGNLSNTAGSGNYGIRGTIAVSSGLWYWEFSVDQTSPTNHHGVWSVTEYMGSNYIGQTAGSWGMYDSNGNKRNNGSFLSYGSAFNQGDIGMVALDMNNGYIYWGKNGVWFNSGNPATQTNPGFTNLSGYTVAPATLQYTAASYNFGQRAWQYTPPAGFSALTTKNFVRPTGAAATPNQYFDVVTYTGNGTTTTISSLNFQPDLVWIKDRTDTNNYNNITDSVRGATLVLQSNTTAAEQTFSTGLTSFNSNGFTVGSNGDVNNSAQNYVAWCWRANGAAVSNTAGTITSSVSANTTSGFSIVTYTGTGSAGATIGHGLNAVPNMIIVKARNAAGHWWIVGHSSLNGGVNPWNYYLQLQNTSAISAAGSGAWNSTAPTTSVFSVGTGSDLNASGQTQVAYCWTQIPGFSQFGTYTGTGSTDGPFIYCGFKPRFIMTKRTDSTGDWLLVDTARDTYNPTGKYLIADSGGAEGSATIYDINSNGFKLRLTTDPNISSSTIVYAAFAANPFGNANGTAR